MSDATSSSHTVRITLPDAAYQRLLRLRDATEAATNGEVIRQALLALEREIGSRLRAENAPLTMPAGVPAEPGGVTGVEPDSIPADDLQLRRERGWVASFIRAADYIGSGGVIDWKGDGPNPLQPGCCVRPSVLAEFAPGLDIVRAKLARYASEDAAFARSP